MSLASSNSASDRLPTNSSMSKADAMMNRVVVRKPYELIEMSMNELQVLSSPYQKLILGYESS